MTCGVVADPTFRGLIGEGIPVHFRWDCLCPGGFEGFGGCRVLGVEPPSWQGPGFGGLGGCRVLGVRPPSGPGLGIPVDVAGYRSVFLLGPLMVYPWVPSCWSAKVLVLAHDAVGPQREVIGVSCVRVEKG